MSDTHRSLAIGELAAQAGMSTSRLRYYERRGLIAPPPREAGRRRYHPTVLRRLRELTGAAERQGFHHQNQRPSRVVHPDVSNEGAADIDDGGIARGLKLTCVVLSGRDDPPRIVE
jgi:hypothetical protein